MHHPQTSYIPANLLHDLEQGGFECLKKKVLVTDVFSCSSYAMYLSAAREYLLMKSFSFNILI